MLFHYLHLLTEYKTCRYIPILCSTSVFILNGALIIFASNLDVPGPPAKPIVENMTATACHVTWKPPSHDGGSPITNYVLERKTHSSTQWNPVDTNIVAPKTEFDVSDLKMETEYVFRVSAVNKAGQGKPSEPSDTAKYSEYIGFHV